MDQHRMGFGNANTCKTKVFLSYAHRDGAAIAQRLRADLQKDFEVWLDEKRLVPGSSWSEDIEQAIDATDYVVALCSIGSFHSPICRGEQLRAFRAGKKLIPVALEDVADFPVFLEPYQYIKIQGGDQYDSGLQRLIGVLRSGASASLKDSYVTQHPEPPSLPVAYVHRAKELAALRELVLREGDNGMSITAVRGMGGIGKSVLALALLRDPAIREAYPDGVLWVKFGRNPDLLASMRDVAVALREPWGNHVRPEDGSKQIRRLLRQRAALLVLDDVWDPGQALCFRSDQAASSALLLTTRKEPVVSQMGAKEFRVGVLAEAEAVQILAKRCQSAVDQLPAEAPSIVKECGYLPLAVAIAGARLRSKPPASWKLAWEQLHNSDLEHFGALEEYEHKTIFRAIGVSMGDLEPAARVRYRDIGIFPDDTDIPPATFEVLWKTGASDVQLTLDTWVDYALAEFSTEGRVRFHDVELDYARRLGGDAVEMHQRLLDSYCEEKGARSAWHDIPDDGYLRKHLAYHLEAAGRGAQLHTLLAGQTPVGQNAWYEAKAAIGDIPGYLADVQRAWRLCQAIEASVAEARTTAVTLQVRYALVTASVRNMITSVPDELWLDVLKEKVVTVPDALAQIRQIAEDYRQAASLLTVLDVLEETTRTEAIETALALTERVQTAEKAQLLIRIAPYLSTAQKQRAYQSARSAAVGTSCGSRVDALCAKAAVAPDASLLDQAMKEALAAAEHLNGAYCGRALIDMASSVPSQLGAIVGLLLQQHPPKMQLLSDYKQALNDHVCNLARLLPLVTSKRDRVELAQAAMAAAEGESGFDWARLLGPFAEYIPRDLLRHKWEKFRAGLTEVHGSTDFLAPEGVELARLMPPEMRSEIIEIVFDAVRGMGSPGAGFGLYGKAEAMARLISFLPQASQNIVRRDALDEASRIGDSRKRAAVLHALARSAPGEEKLSILRLAWNSARGLDDGRDVRFAIEGFSRYLSGDELSDALTVLTNKKGGFEETGLVHLARRYSELGETQRSLDILRGITGFMGLALAEGVMEVLPHLPDEALADVLRLIRQTEPGIFRARATCAVAGRWPGKSEELIDEAFRMFGEKDEGYINHYAMIARDLARMGFVRQAMRLVLERIENFEDRTRLLTSIAHNLSPRTKAEDLYWILEETERMLGMVAWADVVASLPLELSDNATFQRALEFVDEVLSLPDSLTLLLEFMPRMTEAERESRAPALLAAIKDVTPDDDKARLLGSVASFLSRTLIDEAIRIGKEIDQRFVRWQFPLAKRLAELRRHEGALQLIRTFPDEVQALALAEIIPDSSGDLRLALLQECLAKLDDCDSRFDRWRVWDQLEPIIREIPVDRLYLLWRDTLPRLARRSRGELLTDLARTVSLIDLLGGRNAVKLSYEALRQTTTWWT